MENPSTNAAGNQAEAERLLGIAEKLLDSRDLTSSREFAVLAQETEPLLEGSDQILAICDVLLAGDKRISLSRNNQHDWYAILQVDRRSTDLDLMKRNYRRLALLLHPDKNKYPLSNSAFRLVADAWAVLSDQSKKSSYDGEVGRFTRVELTPRPPQYQPESDKLPVRRSSRVGGGADRSGEDNGGGSRPSNFWTACPYCYVLYEYPSIYEDCCLRCQSCQRAFHAAPVPSLPPVVPGKEAYYCCWGFFPLGFSVAGKKGAAAAFPNWMPPMFSGSGAPSGKSARKMAPTTPAAATVTPIRTEAATVTPIRTAAATVTPTTQAAATVAQDEQVRRESVFNFSDGNVSAAPHPHQAGTGIATTPAPKKRGRPRKNPV